MTVSVFLCAGLLALAGAVLALRARRSAHREERRRFDAAVMRVREGGKGVRFDPSFDGLPPRLASHFNALLGALEEPASDAPEKGTNGLRAFAALQNGLRAEPHGHRRTLVLLVEVARFQSVRARIGYQPANELLGEVAARIRTLLPHVRVGRIGRTTIEAAVDLGTADDAEPMLEELCAALERPLHVAGLELNLPVTVAAVDIGTDAIRDEFVDLAASALARAREEHRKVALVDAAASQRAPIDLSLLRDLPAALAGNQLDLHYQPKLRSRSNTVEAVEALLRWQHPVHGAVRIDGFIKLAEEAGAIRQLTEWVLARAIGDLGRLQAAGHDIAVDINISGQLLHDQAFAAQAVAMVAEAPGRVGFEITETAVIQDPDRAMHNLRTFNDAGIKIAIDDYGSGLSSLAYLKQLPAQELKIDRLFIKELVDSHRDPLLVRSSIDLAHALEMEVTAEGVDDPMALSLLRVMGCDAMQGFLISHALPIDELLAFLAEGAFAERLADASHFGTLMSAAAGR